MSTTTTPHPRITLPLPIPGTLPPTLRSTLNTALLATSSIHTIHASLLSSAQSSGWLETIRARALDLLREGEAARRAVTYGEVLTTILREAKSSIVQANGAGERVSGAGEVVNGRDASTNGESRTNGGSANGLSHKRRRGSSALSDDHEDEPGPAAPPPSKKHKPDVRVPQTVITAGVKVVREVLEGLVDVLDVDGGGEGR